MAILQRDPRSSSGWRVGSQYLTYEDQFEIEIGGDSLACSLNGGRALCDLGHIDLELLEGFETHVMQRHVRSTSGLEAPGAPAPIMARKEQRPVALELLREFLNSARSLIVCDAYFFAEAPAEHISEFMSLLPETIQSVEVFFRQKMDWVMWETERALTERNISLELYQTRDIHDRIWITDGKRAMHVGTSFNGLGRRTAFILTLPDDDLVEFLQVLQEIRNGNQPFHNFIMSRALNHRPVWPHPAAPSIGPIVPPIKKGQA
jgi:hypothetical protein